MLFLSDELARDFPSVKGSLSILHESRNPYAPAHMDGAKDQEVSYNARKVTCHRGVSAYVGNLKFPH